MPTTSYIATTTATTTTTTALMMVSNKNQEDDNDDDDDERELIRVRRGGGSRRGRDAADDVDYYGGAEGRGDYNDIGRKASSTYNQRDYYDEDEDDSDEEDEDDKADEDEEYDLFENVLIPNPILDSMDPDGAAERFPELASDWRFWLDLILFIAFVNFLSSVGPQDTLPDFYL